MVIDRRGNERARAAESLADDARAMLETIPNSIITTDAGGRIEIFNLASEPIFLYTAEEMAGQHIGILFPQLGELRGGPGANGELPLAAGQEVETIARRRDGTTFPIELAVGAINVQGRGHLVCVVRDVSARKQAEQRANAARDQLIQAEKLASLGGLVAGIAHEINTPIGVGVTAASHLQEQTRQVREVYRAGTLKRSALEQYFEHAGQAVDILMTNLSRASALVQSFKQVAVDQSSSERRRFAVKGYIKEVLLSLRPKLKVTAHEVVLECPEDFVVDSFPGALSQILTNLIVNALEHAYDPGQAGRIRIRVRAHKDVAELSFSDDGKGIPEANMKHIFDPFFTTRRGEGGSGLGLHIVHNLVVKTLGGEIGCTSGNQGTSFRIRFPLQPKETA
jgi:PAS domain S-box-containing protein